MSVVAYETIDCPYCGNSQYEVFAAGTELDTFRFYRRFPGFDQLNYVICRGCSLIFANPRIAYTDGTLNSLFPTHVEKRAKEMTWCRATRVRKESAACVRKAANLLGRRRGRFLEIGFGFCHALRAAVDLGFDAVGTELFEAFVDRGRAAGLSVLAGSVDAIGFEDDTFDVVYMEDVLEHLKNPIAYCREVRRVLRLDGILFVHTWVIDNPTTVVDAFGERWRFDYNLDLTAHTTIFPTRLLLTHLADCGLRLEKDELTNSLAGGPAARANRRNLEFRDYYFRRVR